MTLAIGCVDRLCCLVQVDPGNAQLMRQHVSCAALEAPVLPSDSAYFGPGLVSTTRWLVDNGVSNLIGIYLYRSCDVTTLCTVITASWVCITAILVREIWVSLHCM